MKIVLVCITIFFIWVSLVSPASAQIVPQCGADGISPCTLCDFWKLGHNIINFLLWTLAIPVLTVLLLWGGTVWTTSGGSPGQITKGKQIMTTGLVGILIALSAWLIVNTIIQTLAAEEFRGAWNTFPICENPIKTEPVSVTTSTPVVQLWDLVYKSTGAIEQSGFPDPQSCENQRANLAGLAALLECKPSNEMPPGYYTHNEAIAALGAITTNRSGQNCDYASAGLSAPTQCGSRPAGSPTACTSLDLIPKSTIATLKLIQNLPFYISGGTEAGHTTHGLCKPVVDLVPGTPGNKKLNDLPLLHDAAITVGAAANKTFCELPAGSIVDCSTPGADHLHVQFVP